MFKLRIFTDPFVRTVTGRQLPLSNGKKLIVDSRVMSFTSSFSSSSSSKSTTNLQQSSSTVSRNKEALFLDQQVQQILKKITGYDESRIFSKQPVSGYKPPKYLFLTDEELEITRERARITAMKKLQMPPVMEPWEEKDYILSVDPELANFDICNLLITDLSHGHTDRSRLIAVREPNGVLRRARWSERYRANQVYYPVPGREVEPPQMFEPENLESIMKRDDYIFILDRACIQFEPDDPKYIDIVQRVYDHVNETKKYDILRSTKHFGPMAFYLAFHDRIDFLLVDMIKRSLIEDAAKLIHLYYIVNPSETRQPIDFESTDHITTIRNYMKTECKNRHPLEISLRLYEEIANAKEDNQKLMASHG